MRISSIKLFIHISLKSGKYYFDIFYMRINKYSMPIRKLNLSIELRKNLIHTNIHKIDYECLAKIAFYYFNFSSDH